MWRNDLTAAVLVLASVATAQTPLLNRETAPPVSILRQAHGVQRIDGGILGLGPDYEVRFAKGGVEFVPALGAAAPHDLPLRFRLESVRRSDRGPTLAVAPIEATADGQIVRYVRQGVVESYEIRSDGVEQSFRFDALPEGAGDLAVRGRVDTELVGTADGAGMAFALDGIGGVHIGAVTGVDAAGDRARGSLRYAGGALEMVLPAAFIDRAALPLVVDPLISTTLSISVSTTFMDLFPDVAFNATADVYLVVWARRFSSSNAGIRGQRVRADGSLLGSLLGIASAGEGSPRARVANVAARNRFVVVWQDQGDIKATSVSPYILSTTAPIVTVAGTTDLEITPDVGGEATAADDDALVVWDNVTRQRLETRQVNVQADGTLLPFSLVGLTAGTTRDWRPEIARSGGAAGRFLVAWHHGVAAQSTVWGAILDRNQAILVPPFQISRSTGDNDWASVDGDGTNWVVALETEAISGSTENDLYLKHIQYEPALGTVSQNLSSHVTTQDQRNPAVAWVGGSYLIPHAEETALPDYDLRAMSVDPASCGICEAVIPVDLGGRVASNPRVASRKSGGADEPEEALIVWHTMDPSSGDIDVLARLFLAEDGIVTDLGGGCGDGTALATCARRGNGSFRFRLQHGPLSAPAHLLVATERMDMACYSCVLVPDLFRAFIFPATTTASGNAALQAAIPNVSGVVGARLYSQWMILSNPGYTCFPAPIPQIHLSNALSIVIQ